MARAFSPIRVSTILVTLNPSFRTAHGRMKKSVASEKAVKARSWAHSGPPTPNPTRMATKKAPAEKKARCSVLAKNSSVRKRNASRVQCHQAIEGNC